MMPLLGISTFSCEFPSLLGGIIGLGISASLAHFKVGFKSIDHKESVRESSRHPMNMGTISERSMVASSSPFMPGRGLPLTSEEGTSGLVDDKELCVPLNSEDEEYVPRNGANGGVSNESSVNSSWMLEDGGGDTNEDNNIEDQRTSQTTELSTITSIEDLTDSQRAIENALGPRKSGMPYMKEFLLRTSPLTLTVIILIITRIPQIGLNTLLKKTSPHFSIYFGSYGTFKLSASLVFQLENILTYPNLNWK